MSNIDSTSLLDPNHPQAGVACSLNDTFGRDVNRAFAAESRSSSAAWIDATAETVVTIQAHSHVAVATTSVTRPVAAAEHDTAGTQLLTHLLPPINALLDLASARGVGDRYLTDPLREFHAWWLTPDGWVHRMTTGIKLTFRMEATVSVSPPQPLTPPPDWHPALRYWRLGQLTDDLFDAYRNVYLALESLLSTLRPQLPAERDVDWLRQALTAVGRSVPLSRFAASGAADAVEFDS